MKRLLSLALLASAALAAPASAADVPPGAKWVEQTIPSTDGVQLHADILRPANLPDTAKTPVILSIGPYFNHSGQTGPAGPAEGTSYDPTGPSTGPSDRFYDFVNGAKLMERGYTFMMVDLRGFGGSTGCLDWGGPGEQSDVVEAVKWAASQPWSNGAVGMYGKSYDGVTGLVGVDKQPAGLKAVVAQEPVYDLYRYLYGDGIRRLNSLATPALYDAIAGTPGPLGDDPNYTAASLNDPACLALNHAAQQDDDHTSEFWKARDLIPGAKNSNVPLFLTQGLTENNTAPDGTAEYLQNHTGYERAWLGPWEHVRGGETCAEDDASTGCNANNVGRLKMGRKGWYDEVILFYDRFLKNQDATAQDPVVAVQTNDGKWRAEDQWPPVDAGPATSILRTGEYTDTGQSTGTGSGSDATSGVWTVSKPLPYDAHLAGAAQAVVDVEASAPNANLAVDLYDLDKNGSGPLIARQGSLIRESGKLTLNMMSADWRIPAGHRIGVRITDTNTEWWALTMGTNSTVTVKGASISIPFLRYKRQTGTIEGAPGVQLASYLADKVTLSAAQLKEAESPGFTLPPAMTDRPAAPATTTSSSSATATGAPATRAKAAKRLSAKLRALRKGRLVVSGKGPKGTKLTIKLRRGKKVVARKRVTVKKSGKYRVTFRLHKRGRYSALVTGLSSGTRLKAKTRTAKLRLT